MLHGVDAGLALGDVEGDVGGDEGLGGLGDVRLVDLGVDGADLLEVLRVVVVGDGLLHGADELLGGGAVLGQPGLLRGPDRHGHAGLELLDRAGDGDVALVLHLVVEAVGRDHGVDRLLLQRCLHAGVRNGDLLDGVDVDAGGLEGLKHGDVAAGLHAHHADGLALELLELGDAGVLGDQDAGVVGLRVHHAVAADDLDRDALGHGGGDVDPRADSDVDVAGDDLGEEGGRVGAVDDLHLKAGVLEVALVLRQVGGLELDGGHGHLELGDAALGGGGGGTGTAGAEAEACCCRDGGHRHGTGHERTASGHR